MNQLPPNAPISQASATAPQQSAQPQAGITSNAQVSMPGMGTKPGAPSQTSSVSPTASGSVNGDFTFSTVGELCGAEAGVKILVYGNAGMGKTVLMATLPMPFIIVSTENGLLSLSVKNLTKIFIGLGLDEASAAARAEMVKRQRVLVVRNGLQLKRAYEWLISHMSEFASLGWDSSSETAEVMLIASKSVKADGRQAYGEVADLISEYFKKFRDHLPGKHVCVIAKEGSTKDEVTGGMKWGPDFPGKQLGPQSPYWMDETFRIAVATDPASNQPFRYLQTQPNEQFIAKDRSGLLDQFERPDLSFLIDKIVTQ